MEGIDDKLVYASENLVDLTVVAPIVLPTFDHSVVVAMDEEVGVMLTLWDKDCDEAFKTDGLSPGDVSFSTVCDLPTGDEAPCSPSVTNGDGNADPRACIREHSNICECYWFRDGAAEIGLEEGTSPPVKVVGKAFWGMQ